MAFDDLNDDEEEESESDSGDEALDELAGTLSGETSSANSNQTSSEVDEEEPEYDPESEPAFPTAKTKTQHSIYCLPETWDTIDGASGLLFEAEIKLRRNGYDSVQKRELHNALLQAAADQLSPEDIEEAFIQTRRRRKSGEIIEE